MPITGSQLHPTCASRKESPRRPLDLCHRPSRTNAGPIRDVTAGGSRDYVRPDTGVFTSGIVSVTGGHRIGLFFTGRKHAGENLAKVLARRAATLTAPIQMCDALSRNVPGELATIMSNCRIRCTDPVFRAVVG
jgi:hypothetical protein